MLILALLTGYHFSGLRGLTRSDEKRGLRPATVEQGFVEREENLATSHFLGHVHHELAVIRGSFAQMSAEFAQIPRILA